jgi:chaperonin cofactor prefoldin
VSLPFLFVADGSVSRGSPPSLGGLREDRDRLSRDNEDLREKLNTLQNELVDLGSNLVGLPLQIVADGQESTKQERDDALSRLTAAREASSTGLRSSQNASSEIDRLRADLEIAENNYHRAEAALEQESSTVQALTIEVSFPE